MREESNVLTYLRFRGDLTFRQSPFNEVDALIFSLISSIRYDGIVAGPGTNIRISVRDVYENLLKKGVLPLSEAKKRAGFDKKQEDDAGNMPASPLRMEILLMMTRSRRYQGVTFSDYVWEMDDQMVKQFSAVHIHYGRFRTYIAFRGTDHSFTGWKEDLMMTYTLPTAGQARAAIYLQETVDVSLKNTLHRYVIGGHSKGGANAVYGAVFCPAKVQKKLERVYNFDGPGFQKNLEQEADSSSAYRMIRDRIITIAPGHTLVAVCLPWYRIDKVVKSFGEGMGQHSGFTWEVSGDHLVRMTQRDAGSIQNERMIQGWVNDMSLEERKDFTEAFIHLLQEAGLERFEDVFSLGVRDIIGILGSIQKVPAKERNLVLKELNNLRHHRE